MLASTFAWMLGLGAAAHETPYTVISLDVNQASVTAELTIPEQDLELASGISLGADLDPGQIAELKNYLADHFSVSSEQGQWQVEIRTIALGEPAGSSGQDVTDVLVEAELIPAQGEDVRSFTIGYDVVIHHIVSAKAYVLLNSDFASGNFDTQQSLGVIATDTRTGEVPPLEVRLDSTSNWQVFGSLIQLGIMHIAEGSDHQFFLMALLLSALAGVGNGRLLIVGVAQRPVRALTLVSLAFTLGHSMSLALGVLGAPFDVQIAEILVAASILISGIHAWKPIYAGKEALVAGAFGIIHGLAFSTALTDLEIAGGQWLLSLLGFNLGIEIMQLALLASAFIPLFVLARTWRPAFIQRVGAALICTSATGWFIARLGYGEVLGSVADLLAASLPYLLLVALFGATWQVIRARRKVL